MDEEERLIDTLRKIEALFARPGTAGEKTAAGEARERIRRRLAEIELAEKPIEYRFTMNDTWSVSVFMALLRRYGLKPFRYRGQRRTTVMARVTKTFVQETLWPEFQEISQMLRRYLDEVTQRVIREAIHGDMGDAEERAGSSAGEDAAGPAIGVG